MRSIIDKSSVEFVNVPVTPPDGIEITSQPVSIAIKARGQSPATGDFRTAAWKTGTSTARVLVGPGQLALVPGVYTVYVKVTDSPEVPVIPAGSITVT